MYGGLYVYCRFCKVDADPGRRDALDAGSTFDGRMSFKEDNSWWDSLMEEVKGKPISERAEIFDRLSWEEKLQVNGFPPMSDCTNPLPEDLPVETLVTDTPANLEKKKAAVRHVLAEMKKESGNDDEQNEETDEEDEESDDISSGESCDGEDSTISVCALLDCL